VQYTHINNVLFIQKLEAYSLNNTGHAKKELIFFNRVPKVGSQTFMEILRLLSLRNQFVFYQDHVQRVETIRLAETEQVNIILMYPTCILNTYIINAYAYKNYMKMMKFLFIISWCVLTGAQRWQQKIVTNFVLITASSEKKICTRYFCIHIKEFYLLFALFIVSFTTCKYLLLYIIQLHLFR